ncbi:MAG: aldo/keto reductase, partial [Hyphomicrobium sp.]|nr:aldo/keto reductase [Hyphomicrobium sp.]
AAAVAVQGWYNLVERNKYEGALRDVVTKHGLAFFSYYSLANGFLTGKYRSQDDLGKSARGLRNVQYVGSPKGDKVLAALEDVAAQTGAALAGVALAWTMAQAGVTAPIASATSLSQLDEILGALTLELTPAQIAQLDAASA